MNISYKALDMSISIDASRGATYKIPVGLRGFDVFITQEDHTKDSINADE